MKNTPILTEEDYREALWDIGKLMGAEGETPEGAQLDALVTLVETYESAHHPLAVTLITPDA